MAREEQTAIGEIILKSELSSGRRTFLNFYYLLRPLGALKLALKWIQPETYAHSVDVQALSMAVGRKYRRIYRRRINRHYLKTAAFFHDIGKLAIKRALLKKPGRLTPLEKRLIRKHPDIGNLIVKGLLPRPVRETIRSHHEERDRSGYPRRIGKDRMSIITEIVSTVDDFCAMTEGRLYCARKCPTEALKELERQAGGRYDERIVNCLRAVIQDKIS